MSDCNCNKTASPSEEYLMVKASASQAATCGVALPSTTSVESCAKQEPMYDASLSDFLVPLESSSTNMIVCNSAIYSTGIWLQFLNPVVTLKITNITDNTLTLVNRCENGDIVSSNPAVGVAVAKGARFVVVDQPDCVSNSDFLLKVISALSTATEVCLPSLVSSTTTAIIHPVGRVESDPSNLSAGKCLKKIFGILFKAGRPFLSALGGTIGHNNLDYRRLVRHKTTGGVYEKDNYSDAPQLEVNKQYLLAITNSEEKLFGPTYITKFTREQLEENTTDKDHLSWPTFSGSYDKDYDMGDYAGLTPPAEAFLDHYYVMCRLEIACSRTGDDVVTMQAELNGIRVGRCVGATSADYLVGYNAVTIPVRVNNSDDKLTLRLTTTGTTRYYFRLHVDGIYY